MATINSLTMDTSPDLDSEIELENPSNQPRKTRLTHIRSVLAGTNVADLTDGASKSGNIPAGTLDKNYKVVNGMFYGSTSTPSDSLGFAVTIAGQSVYSGTFGNDDAYVGDFAIRLKIIRKDSTTLHVIVSVDCSQPLDDAASPDAVIGTFPTNVSVLTVTSTSDAIAVAATVSGTGTPTFNGMILEI